MSSSKVTAPTRKSGFAGFFGLLLELCIVAGALMWVAYAYLPHQYYLPISFLSICVVGLTAFVILNKRVAI